MFGVLFLEDVGPPNNEGELRSVTYLGWEHSMDRVDVGTSRLGRGRNGQVHLGHAHVARRLPVMSYFSDAAPWRWDCPSIKSALNVAPRRYMHTAGRGAWRVLHIPYTDRQLERDSRAPRTTITMRANSRVAISIWLRKEVGTFKDGG